MQNLVNEGDLIAGKYRVEKVLGAGGMGVVVAAMHLQLDEKVAIKFLLPEMLNIPEAVQRFTREARAAVKIKSEHVARVFDVGTLENGAPYMVMEYLEGGDLADWLERRGALPVQLAVDFVLQASEALADAHSLGIVHRDLKPANLFCIRRSDGSSSIKVLDFGISRFAGLGGSSDLGLTKTSAMMGSPRYMSPEQMQSSRNVDARTDIWALGAILYELVSGIVPFEGETLPEVCLKITTQEPPRLRDLKPGVPAALEAAISRCLAKDRNRRFQDTAELAAAIAPFASERGRHSASRIANVLDRTGKLRRPPDSQPVAATTGVTAAETPVARERSGRSKAVIAVLGGAIVAAGGGLYWTMSSRPPPPSPPPAAEAPATRPEPPRPTITKVAATAPAPEPPAAAPPPTPAVKPPPQAAPPTVEPPASRHKSASRRGSDSRRATPAAVRSSITAGGAKQADNETRPPPPPAKTVPPPTPAKTAPEHAAPRGLIDDRR